MQQLPPNEFVDFLRPVFQEDELKLIIVGAILGMGAGMQWDKVNMSMDAMMDSNKFANYGQLGSRLDLITKQQQDKFQSCRLHLVSKEDLFGG